MPKFKSKEHAHKVHENYNVDTDVEEKYNLNDIYHIGRNRIKFILTHVPQDSHVLEVGCNSGGLLRLLYSENKCYCEGIDISPEMVKKALEKGLNCKVAAAEKLPYPDNRFECVVISEVLEHLYNPQETIDEIYRVLKPNGVIVGTVPHPESENSTRKSVEDHHWHNTIFTQERLKALIETMFTDILIENISWYNDQENRPQWIGFIARKE